MKGAFIVLAAACLMSGCIGFRVGTAPEPERVKISGLASGYVSTTGIRKYDGTIVQIGLLTEAERDGEIVSVDVWPLVGVGVGVVGVRAHIFQLDAGVGVLFYKPEPLSCQESVWSGCRPPNAEKSPEPPRPAEDKP